MIDLSNTIDLDTLVTPTKTTKIALRNGIPTITSRDIAFELNKAHKTVLGKIREVLTRQEYMLSGYIDESGKSNKEYILSKDSFILLVMNFQGYNEFKRNYINEFNRMESHIKLNQQLDSYMIEDPIERAKKWIQEKSETDKIKQQNETLMLNEMINQPKIDFYDVIADTKDCLTFGETAKLIGMKKNNKIIGRNTLMKILRERKVIDRYNIPYQQYVKYFNVILTKYETKYGKIKTNKKSLVKHNGLNQIIKMLKQLGYNQDGETINNIEGFIPMCRFDK